MLVAALCLVVALPAIVTATTAAKPHIFMVVVDDFGWGVSVAPSVSFLRRASLLVTLLTPLQISTGRRVAPCDADQGGGDADDGCPRQGRG